MRAPDYHEYHVAIKKATHGADQQNKEKARHATTWGWAKGLSLFVPLFFFSLSRLITPPILSRSNTVQDAYCRIPGSTLSMPQVKSIPRDAPNGNEYTAAQASQTAQLEFFLH